ncbi:MAG TPA: endolytic transglycosylase MltG [Candidatus Tumulicola sp.]|nr:endolytic transglycosylase MltG [Candidatus Tumulicola sp.]
MRRAILIIAIVAAALGLLVAAALAWLVYGDRSLPAQSVTLMVERGSGVAQIASLLKEHGVVRSTRLLSAYLRWRGTATRINAAEYTFSARETLPEVTAVLESGGRPPTTWITIPEGFTALQIAQRLSAMRLPAAADFMHVVRTRSVRFGAAHSNGLEGFLYPETYQIALEANAEDIAARMTEQFGRELPRDYAVAAKRLGYSLPQIVTIASIIEREAKADAERPVMAGVYYNRLRRKMPLEVDATIEYALPKHKYALSFRDLAVDSPYNTYTHVGLPPTPISNPGRRSILAALHPRPTTHLYYVYCGKGRHEFSDTLAEQQAAEQRCLH